MWPRLAACALAACAALAATTPALGQSPAAAPDLSGYWELRYDSMRVPRASLTRDAAAAQELQTRGDAEVIAACQAVGMPAIMADRAPLDIRQSAAVIGIVAKLPSSTRYIYTDGRPHPPLDEYEPTTNGHSIGRWESDTLVVETVGFGDRGIREIPGGGYRTSASRLTERYRLLDGGLRLAVTFTWEDPKVFQTLHTYEYRYYRVRDIALPRIYQCNPADPERTRFLTESPRAR
jgi:hypothetical protein